MLKLSQDRPDWKELSELRQRQAQIQTRLPARLPAPKLLLLAHVISLEQSREEGRVEGRGVGGGGGAGSQGADLGLSWREDLAQRFRFTQELKRERSRDRFGNWRSGQG